MITLDMQSRLPIYEQLRNQISELILLGRLNADDQLPSVRSFARELGINPNTVQKAYIELERENIIYSVAGRGSFISPNQELIKNLQERQLDKIKQAALQSKACALTLEQVIQAVNEIYGGNKNV